MCLLSMLEASSLRWKVEPYSNWWRGGRSNHAVNLGNNLYKSGVHSRPLGSLYEDGPHRADVLLRTISISIPMATTQSDLLTALAEIELAAEEVLASKQEIIDLDRKRNSNREAIRALEKEAKSHYGEESKSWLAMGNSFFRLPNRSAVDMLKTNQKKLDISVNRLRSDLKDKVNSLRDNKGKEELKGFGLVALSQDEFSAISGDAKPTPMYQFK